LDKRSQQRPANRFLEKRLELHCEGLSQ
jgi:hypothetical protein